MLLVEGQTLSLSPAVVDVDAATFERHVAEGTTETLEEAAGLYEGDLLQGFGLNEPMLEEWLLPERERLRELIPGDCCASVDTQNRASRGHLRTGQ
jgi:DNA-binding SARP family transcriptional activator